MKKNKGSKRSVLILGGAGFIGSHLALKFHEEGCNVTVIDGLLPKTGGRIENLQPILNKINFFQSEIEKFKNLDGLIGKSDTIIDCMATTSHLSANENPLYDLKLNVSSHLHLINQLKHHPDKLVIYLGSRAQYGNPKHSTITEETPMVPEDIQGAHKLCAESHFRIFSKICGLHVISLRIPNCFGPHQPFDGEDVGLVGNFIRDLLGHKTIDLFRGNRWRTILYVKDLAQVVFRLSQKPSRGFRPFVLAGIRIRIEQLVKTLIRTMGIGSYTIKAMPKKIKAIEMGNAVVDDSELKVFIGGIQTTDLVTGLKQTINYFRDRYRDQTV